MAEIIEQRIGLDLDQPGVSLLVGTLQPLEELIALRAKRVRLSDLKGRISVMLCDELSLSGIRILFPAERMIS